MDSLQCVGQAWQQASLCLWLIYVWCLDYNQGWQYVVKLNGTKLSGALHEFKCVWIHPARRVHCSRDVNKMEVKRRLCICAKILSCHWQKPFVHCQRVMMWITFACLFFIRQLISAHYPDLPVTGLVTLSRPIRKVGCCCILINFYISDFLTLWPRRC